MKTFELTPKMQTGIDEIDNQHRKLISWANFLAIDDADDTDRKVSEALDNLQDYVVYHFPCKRKRGERGNAGGTAIYVHGLDSASYHGVGPALCHFSEEQKYTILSLPERISIGVWMVLGNYRLEAEGKRLILAAGC
jgi:hypothetical protein